MSLSYRSVFQATGVASLAQLPVDWKLLPLKAVATCNDDVLDEATSSDTEIDYVEISDVDATTGIGAVTRMTFGEAPSRARRRVQGGDVILSTVRTYLRAIAALSAPPPNLIVSTGFAVVRPRSIHSGYLGYALRQEGFLSEVVARSVGVSYPAINASEIMRLCVPVPGDAEQRLITEFLDRETAKIDALVAEQERLIALLKEKRQALISHAVTKGLDPNVPMKDSGVEWLGRVPAHWALRSLASMTTKITNGFVGPTRDILCEVGIRYLQSLHIKSNRISFDPPYYVAPDWSERHTKSILKVDDVLIVQTGDIGQVAVVSEEFAGCNCHALIIASPRADIATGKWLSWIFNSSQGRDALLSIQTGALHPHLNCGNVKLLMLPVPSVHEQLEIVRFVESMSAAHDELIATATEAVRLLQERRAALISAAVTGKIDVRGLA